MVQINAQSPYNITLLVEIGVCVPNMAVSDFLS